MDKLKETSWVGEICKKCNRRNPVGFHISGNLWKEVAGMRYSSHVLCLTCFDELAERSKVSYSVKREDLYPVSWSDWGEEE